MQPDTVFDVGSMDGSDARRFRRLLPSARIIAIEGNPDNADAMNGNPLIQKARIEVRHVVVWNENAPKRFFVESIDPDAGGSEAEMLQGISSTRERKTNSIGTREISVDGYRLDTLMDSLEPRPGRIALWIDVEGAAFEVLEGLAGVKDDVALIHVEVETRMYWEEQRLKPDVVALAESYGFHALARGHNEEQHDIVLINTALYRQQKWQVDLALYQVFVFSNRLKLLSPGVWRSNGK